MQTKEVLLNKRCILYYKKDSDSPRFGIVTGYDESFVFIEGKTAVPISALKRIEVSR